MIGCLYCIEYPFSKGLEWVSMVWKEARNDAGTNSGLISRYSRQAQHDSVAVLGMAVALIPNGRPIPGPTVGIAYRQTCRDGQYCQPPLGLS